MYNKMYILYYRLRFKIKWRMRSSDTYNILIDRCIQKYYGCNYHLYYHIFYNIDKTSDLKSKYLLVYLFKLA